MTKSEYITYQKWKNGRKFKVTKSYDTRDYVKFYRSIKPKDKRYNLSIDEYRKIMFSVGRKMMEEYIESGRLYFPYAMGLLELQKVDKTPIIKNGNLIIRQHVDWGETLNLWYDDEEAREKNILVRYKDKTSFRNIYIKKGAQVKYKKLLDFDIVRSVKMKINELANENKIEGFNKYKKWKDNILV